MVAGFLSRPTERSNHFLVDRLVGCQTGQGEIFELTPDQSVEHLAKQERQ